MYWVNEKCLSFMQMLCIKMVKLVGVLIPRHIAIIMDGNRRFAKRGGLNTSDGHSKGFDKLAEALKVYLFIISYKNPLPVQVVKY